MSQRLIDVTLHELTAPQILEQLLRYFNENTNELVVVVAEPGRTLTMIRTARSYLSQIRKRAELRGHRPKQFGFDVVTEAIPLSLRGELLEGFGIKYKVTLRQQMMNLAADESFDNLEFGNEPVARKAQIQLA